MEGVVQVEQGERAVLPCLSEGHPSPKHYWYRLTGHGTSTESSSNNDGEGSLALKASDRVFLLPEGPLIIHKARIQDNGRYLCVANNSAGEDKAHVELLVTVPLSARIEPAVQVVDVGRGANLSCRVAGHPVHGILWTHNGLAISSGHSANPHASVISRSGSRKPTSGGPSGRFSLLSRDLLHVSTVERQDGGMYQCTVYNHEDSAQGSSQLVIGEDAPVLEHVFSERQLRPGGSVSLRCSASGNPLPQVTWSFGWYTRARALPRPCRRLYGRSLPQNHRQHSFPNGSLVITEVQRSVDSGWYACVARDPQGNTARGQLAVHVMSDLPITIQWLKDGLPLDPELEASVAKANDYTSFLSFTGVRQLHSGNYTCVASNPATSSNYSSEMIVRVPPTWRQEPVDKAAVMGQAVSFDCQADGFPVPVIRWKKEHRTESGREFSVIISNANVQILENGSLSIREADRLDAGHYMCQALNGVGPGISTVVKLDVHVAAHFERKFHALTVRRGDNVALTCRAVGEPPITVTWLRDRHAFSPAMEPRDSSLFSCFAENAYGRDDTNFQVVVQEPPEKPRGLEVSQSTSRSVTISWTAPYSGNSAVTKYRLEYKHRDGTWKRDSRVSVIDATETSHVVSALRPKTAYEFRLRAENAIGLSEFSDSLMVTTDEEAPSGAPREIKVTPTGSRSLHITWKPPLDEDSNGLVQGYYVGYRVRDAKESFAYKTLESSPASSLQQCELTDLRRNTRYSVVVQAFNAKGAGPVSEEVHSQTLEIDPPTAPRLKLISSTSSSVHLSWTIEREQPVNGFVLFHKAEPPAPADAQSAEDAGEWSEVQTGPERSAYAYRGLRCGRKYSFYVVAFNAAGRGPRSNVVHAKTDGSVPLAPEQRDLVESNVTSVTLQLGAWKSGGCPYLLVRRAVQAATAQGLVTSTVPPPQWTQAVDAQRRQIRLILPIVSSLLVLVLVSAVVCYVFSRRRLSATPRRHSEELDEAQEVTKSIDTVPMSVWEKPKQQTNYKDPQQQGAMEREQLYYPSPYDAGGRRLASLYAPEGLHSGWESARSLNGAAEEPEDERIGPHHTYDVPFLRSLAELSARTGAAVTAIVYMSPEKCNSLRKSLQAGNIIESYPNGNVSYVYSRPKKKHWRNHDEELLYADHKLRKLSRYADELKQAQMSAKDSVLETGVEAYELSEAECDMPTRRFAMQR
ncbi:hypothetical protein MTO96_020778 [Rhipicephalus appendiculatus]